jgi:hypothetical protein
MNWITVAVASALVALVACAVHADRVEEARWQKFSVAHHCRIAAKMPGDVFNTFDGKNVGIGATPDKTGWACDDGVTYFRED